MLHIQVFEVTFTELVTEAVTISKIRKKVPYRKQNSTSNGALIKVISNYWCQVHALSTVVFLRNLLHTNGSASAQPLVHLYSHSCVITINNLKSQ